MGPVRLLTWLSLAAAVAACESVKVVAPDVATVNVSPTGTTLLPGETVQLTAQALDAEGNPLSREASWATGNSGIAAVSTSGLVTAVDAGSTTIRATVEGRSGTASITVVRGPAIQLDPATLELAVTKGVEAPPARVVTVSNAGSGTLDGLEAVVQYQGPATEWLSALLTTTTAPAQLRASADIESLEVGTYRASILVSSPDADNSPQALPVTLVVSEQPPVIDLSPASVGFGAIEGEGDPTPRVVTIENGGGGALTQIQAQTIYQGAPQGWLETTLSSSSAPATLTLQARTGELTEGVYLAVVRVTAPGALNSPRDVNVTFTVGRPPPTDLIVFKEGPVEVDAGAELEYKVTVRNDGPALAVGVILTDTLPEGVSLAGISDGGQVSDGVVTWPVIESLPVGASAQRTATVVAPPSGELINLAAARGTAEDPNPGNNDGSADESRVVTRINELADVEVSKTGPDSVDAVETYSYEIQVSNHGPSPAVHVVVVDSLPAGATFVAATDLGAFGGGVVVWPALDTLDVDETRTYTVTVQAPANPPAGGFIENVVAAVAVTEDPVPDNNDGSAPASRVSTFVRTVADLAVQKTASANTVSAGGRLTYTVRVTSGGPSDGVGVVVSDVLQAGLVHVSNTPSQGTYSPATGVWTVGRLAAGNAAQAVSPDTATLKLVVDVAPSAADSVVNVATVSANGRDPDGANNASRIATKVTRSADVSVTKAASVAAVAAGGAFRYTVTASNAGPSSATGVVVAETLPGGLTVDSVRVSRGSYNSGTQRWSVGSLAPSAGAVMTLFVRAPTNGVNTLTNSVAVTAVESDPDASDNTDAVATPVLYSVGGSVSGLAGTGLVLRNNGGDDLAIGANGAFTFATRLAVGTGYAVTVSSNPTGPTQTCTVANGSGTMGTGNVTNVSVTCVTQSFTVGGTVVGLAGVGLVLQNNGGDDLVVSSNGAFVFPTALLDGSPYDVTVLSQPSGPNQVCSVASGSGTLSGANVTGVQVTCSTEQYTVGGTVSGLAAGNDVVLQNNGGDDLTVSSNGGFLFPTAIDDGSNYGVTVLSQPTTPSQTCVVTNGAGTVNGGNVTNVSVACATDTFSVGGTVTGLAAGNSVVLQNNGGDDLTVSSDGSFTFSAELPDESGYAVTVLTQPTDPNQVCDVVNATGTLNGSDVTDVQVTCVTEQYTVGGAVSGLDGTGLVLQNNGGDDLAIAADGAFAFPALPDGSSYAVTVLSQPTTPDQLCSVANGSGTLSGADVTDVSVTCVNTYTVGGTVSGLVGSGLVLQNNLGDNLPIAANGSFTFPALPDGSAYSVTVFTQPGAPDQVCVVTNGTGSIAGADVTNVSVNCTP